MSFGRSLELYFIDGKPDGMLTAKVFNWTGQVLKAPRTQIRQALARPESGYTGVYLLLGEKDGQPLAYIGESEEISNRVSSHDSKKDWWTTVIFITATGDELNKAHAKYLEARLVGRAKEAGNILLENGNLPGRASLSEAGISNMEEFLDTLLIVLPALGISMFESHKRPDNTFGSKASATVVRFTLKSTKYGLAATAVLDDGDFVVLKGSGAQPQWIGGGSHNSGYHDLHLKLRATGTVVTNGAHAIFAENYAFASPSAAAAVILGRSANGRTEWSVESDGRTYKAWEQQELAGLQQ